MAESIVVYEPPSGLLRPKDKLVCEIVELMTDGRWKRGHSAYALAKRHQCAKEQVMSAASEAARYLRIVADPGRTRVQLMTKLREIVEEDAGDRVPALGMLAKMTGTLEGPKEQAASTPEERIAYLRGALRDPDDELLEAMEAEREAILGLLLPNEAAS